MPLQSRCVCLTCCQRSYRARRRIKHGVSLRRCKRGSLSTEAAGRRCFEVRRNAFRKTLTLHALSTHFNNRPSSQIAVLTPLISTDICSLSSLPPSCFFNQINPNGHPLMASFFRKAKRGEIIKIIKPLGPVCARSSSFFFSSCLQVFIPPCLRIQAAQREKDSSSSLNCIKLTLGGPIFPSNGNSQCRNWSLGACQLSKCGSRGGRARF